MLRFIDNHQVLLKYFFFFFWVLSEVWLIPGLWELVSDYVTLKNEEWITLGWNQIESTLGRGHIRILPHSSLCTPEARPPTLCFSGPEPTHNSTNTPVHVWPTALHLHYASCADRQLLTAVHLVVCPRRRGPSQGKDLICSPLETWNIFQSGPLGFLAPVLS